MKQKIILIFILASHFCSAQKFQAKWGAELKKSEIGDIDKSLGIINDGVFFTTSRFNTVKLRKFSTFNMSQLYQKPIFGDEGGTPDLKRHEYNKGEIFSTKEGFILFSTFYNKNDEHICYANKLDFNGNYVAKPIQLDIINAKSKRKKGVFNFVFSNDSTKFAIVADPGFEKYSDEKYKISLYDAKCNFLKAVEITLPYKDKNFTLQNFDVTNEGDVYMLARIDRDKKELKNLKDEETEYYFQLIKISPLKNGQIKQFDIKLPEKYIESISFITDKFSNIQCLGFYNDMVRRRKANNGINGFFYFKVNNETGQLQNTQTKEFSAQLVEQLENKRRAQKERGLNSSFELKFFLDREDGGLIVVAEEDFIQTQTYCTQNGCRTVYYYHNNEILIINIEPGGQISNITPIVKYQTTMND